MCEHCEFRSPKELRRKLVRLMRRKEFLKERYSKTDRKSDFDKAESSALEWAIDVLTRHLRMIGVLPSIIASTESEGEKHETETDSTGQT